MITAEALQEAKAKKEAKKLMNAGNNNNTATSKPSMNTSIPTEKSAANGNGNSTDYSKYVTMLKNKLPPGAIRQKMSIDRLNDAQIEEFFRANGISEPVVPKTEWKPPAKSTSNRIAESIVASAASKPPSLSSDLKSNLNSALSTLKKTDSGKEKTDQKPPAVSLQSDLQSNILNRISSLKKTETRKSLIEVEETPSPKNTSTPISPMTSNKNTNTSTTSSAPPVKSYAASRPVAAPKPVVVAPAPLVISLDPTPVKKWAPVSTSNCYGRGIIAATATAASNTQTVITTTTTTTTTSSKVKEIAQVQETQAPETEEDEEIRQQKESDVRKLDDLRQQLTSAGIADSPDPSVGTVVYDITKHKNIAFLFIKPHANTRQVQTMIKDLLAECGVDILSKGSMSAEFIEANDLLDHQFFSIGMLCV